MNFEDINYYQEIENILRCILQPIPRISFSTFVRVVSGHKVIPIDEEQDKELIETLKNVGYQVKEEVEKTNGIKAPNNDKLPSRRNEAGNYLENYVKKVLNKFGKAETPFTQSGKRKNVGYPDLVFHYEGKVIYVEIKTYNPKKIESSLRAFYASPPSEKGGFKVTTDGYHVLLAFGLEEKEKNQYFIEEYIIVDLAKLEGRIKHEFNASNKELYNEKTIIHKETFNEKEKKGNV